MKRMLLSTLFAALVAGCQSTQPVAMPPTTVTTGLKADADQTRTLLARQTSLDQQQEALQKTLRELQRAHAARSAVQDETQGRLAKAYNDLRAAAGEMKTIRDRIDVLQAAHETNVTAMAALQGRISTASADLKQLEAQLSGTPGQLAELQRQLAKERQDRADAVALAKQREQEIEKLRRTLAAQPDTLKTQPKAVAADKTQPPVEAEKTPGASPRDEAAKWIAQGNNLLAENKAADAQPLFEAALKAQPFSVEALVGIAACQYAKGDYLAAAKSADRALDISETNARALGVKGLVYRKEGQLSAASSTLEKAVKNDPADARLRNYFGIVLNDRQRSGEAIEQFRKACEIDPGYAEAHFNLAILLATAATPKLEDARHHYQAALALGAERDGDLDKLLGKAQGGVK